MAQVDWRSDALHCTTKAHMNNLTKMSSRILVYNGVYVCKSRAFSSFERWLLPPFFLFTRYVRLVKRAHFAQACRRARIKYQFGARAHLLATFRKGYIPHLGASLKVSLLYRCMGDICLARNTGCQCFEHRACLCQSVVWQVSVRDCCALRTPLPAATTARAAPRCTPRPPPPAPSRSSASLYRFNSNTNDSTRL